MQKTLTPYVIAFDMDGTLLNRKHAICFKTLRYIRKLNKQGHKIILASGRPLRALRKYYKKLHLNTPMICYNGAYLFSPNDKYFPEEAFEFPKEVVVDLVDVLRPHIVNVMCETNKDIYIDKEDLYLAKFFYYEEMNLHYGELRDTLVENPMTCIVQTPCIYEDHSVIDKIVSKYPQLEARFWTNSPYFELHYKGTSKGSCLEKIAKYFNVPKERIIAFGDAGNDFEMLSVAGTSVAMKNCKDTLKDHATRISKYDNNHNGIYHELKEILK